METFAIILFSFIPFLDAAHKLETFTVEKNDISVSGMSSGGAMAVQFHMAYSASVKGLGAFAGEPYHCSEGNLTRALGACMGIPSRLQIAPLVTYTSHASDNGDIDPTDNLKSSKVFIWSGDNDTVVRTEVSEKMERFYDVFMSPTRIKRVTAPGAAHTFPTDNYGKPCSTMESPYIGNCNYAGSYEMLNFIYGNQKQPSSPVALNGKFLEFDQTEFRPKHKKRWLLSTFISMEHAAFEAMGFVMGTMAQAEVVAAASMLGVLSKHYNIHHGHVVDGSLDDVGYIYIPSGCYDSTVVCKLHVVFHGCKMQREEIGDTFAKHAGYNEVGEINNIIMLYPQIKADNSTNPSGCWDWWGYTGKHYDTKTGVQLLAVKHMIERLIGDTL